MRYRAFGRTGLEVSAMGFGCWPMAGDRYGHIEDEEAVAAIRRALELGVTCFDTAPAYGSGHSEEVVGRGKARFVGVSNFTVDMIRTCERERRVDVVQVGYHIFDRRQERELFPYCLERGIGVMGYGSLAHGLLTGAFTPETTFDPNDWRAGGVAFGQPLFRGENFQTNLAVVERLKREVAEPRGVPLSQVALAWVLRNPVISTALVGARTPAEVDANVAGAE